MAAPAAAGLGAAAQPRVAPPAVGAATLPPKGLAAAPWPIRAAEAATHMSAPAAGAATAGRAATTVAAPPTAGYAHGGTGAASTNGAPHAVVRGPPPVSSGDGNSRPIAPVAAPLPVYRARQRAVRGRDLPAGQCLRHRLTARVSALDHRLRAAAGAGRAGAAAGVSLQAGRIRMGHRGRAGRPRARHPAPAADAVGAQLAVLPHPLPGAVAATGGAPRDPVRLPRGGRARRRAAGPALVPDQRPAAAHRPADRGRRVRG